MCVRAWYYLTQSWVHTFPKGICPKVNVMAQLEYEIAYYDSIVHRFNHYTTRTPPSLSLSLSLSLYIYIYIYICVCLRVCVYNLNLGVVDSSSRICAAFPNKNLRVT